MTDEQPKRSPGRPATGQTPVRTIRIGPVWDEAKEYAEDRGETMTAVVEAALRRYVQRARRGVPRTADTDQGIDQSP